MRKWLSITSAVIILLVIAITVALWQFNRVLASSHIENLNYQIKSITFHQIKIPELSFVYHADKIQQTVKIYGLDVNYQWKNLIPNITIVNIDELSLTGLKQQVDKQSLPTASTQMTLPKEWKVPEFFPKTIHIEKLLLKQFCATDVYLLTGKLDAVSSPNQLTIKLIASPGETIDLRHQLHLSATYRVEKNLPRVDAALAIDEQVNVNLFTQLVDGNGLYWSGTLKASAGYLDQWWTPYLNSWNIKFNPHVSELNSSLEKVNIQSRWKIALSPLLNLPTTADLARRKKAITGNLFVDAKIPVPLNIADFGEFSGSAKVDVDIVAGKPDRYSLAIEINAKDPAIPDNLRGMGLQAEELYINAQSKVEEEVSLESLPVEFSGVTKGALQTSFKGHFLLDTFAKKIVIDKLALNGKIKKLNPSLDYGFANTNLDLHAVGYWQPDGFSFGLSEPSQLSTDIEVKSLALDLKSVRLIANKLSVAGKIFQNKIEWKQLQIDSDAALNIEKLSHPQLKPNTWRWHGKTSGKLENFDATGELSVSSALNVQHHLTIKNSDLRLDWKIADLFLLAANPFADTIKQWPPLLSLARGKLNASGNLLFDIDTKNLKKSATQIHLQDIAGIYDTTVFEGLNTRTTLTTLNKTLKIATDEIKINQINKGFILGPFEAAGIYQAGWEKLFAGKLTLKKFSGTLMEGTVSTPAQVFDFNKTPHTLTVSLRQLNLTTLLQQHPASELSGTGLLSGDVPVEISSAGIRIVKGLVAADAPGGKLKYQSARALEMAKTQPSIKLLNDALSDFHYSVLSSEVNYDQNGKLVLSVRLEGKNPKLEQGRPINLNVNLEEDLPALLASIQLSGKVTDIVKKRIQEHMQKKAVSKETH